MATQEIKHDGHRDRMRERISKSGISSLQNHEILEYLLYAFVPRKNTNDIAHALIKKFGSFSSVLNADEKSLLEVDGMTRNAAIFISSLPEVWRVYLNDLSAEKLNLSGRGATREFLANKLYGLPYEQVVALALDTKDRLIAFEKLAKGGGSGVTLSVREILNFAIQHNATSIVLAHNHPSGTLKPSPEDVSFTGEVYNTLAKIGVTLQEHFIFAEKEFFSFADSGTLGKIASIQQDINKSFKEGVIYYGS